jgi:hypothetical protein
LFKLDKKGRLFNPRLSEEWREALNRSKEGKKNHDKRYTPDKPADATSINAECPEDDSSITTNTYTNTKTYTNKKQAKTVLEHVSSLSSDEAVSAPTPTPSPATRVAGKLVEVLRRDNLKPTTKTAWADQCENLVQQHGEATVLRVMDYALVQNPDGFWRGRIYAMKNFVRCFGTILEQANRGTGTRKAADPLAQRAASLQTGHDFGAIAKGDI